ncbi:DNA methyltransferase [Porphyromonas gingivalis]|uniref:site-specific DNA-methyltransferase (adenine-specific) n=1 Tax=Porphyromonas gingivalis F0570 TaxID=1227271 RepID=A0A0E2LN69_PORGN|nr:DNA adenine methylase [Porphyromonas gingivalis]ERJ64027.1 D12 class N6 adenine-specific DNA methyltransferase [Porphyromonas gingivalis F0570]ERJ71222.1 D12 class N6 adenine-specific DNA methyltransferase [Porphyromonas gingivalis F0569]PDP83643.1 DNA methyltransferase [Porphyromonas gingivalis]
MRNTNYSPLRYPGGKSRLVSFVKSVIEQNHLRGGTYIEPFSGGAAIALSLAIDGYMERIVINDYDRSIYAFWYSILHYTDAFIDKICSTPLSVEEWHAQRIIQYNKQNVDLFDLGFSTFFLNRTNRSGILKAGVIGGLNQTGSYKIDARYNKEQLIERIRLIAQHKNKFILHNEDAINLLRRYRNIARENLIYLDPPYYERGRELYVNFFRREDHVALSRAVQQRDNMNWIITYDNHSFIHGLYVNARSLAYTLPYSAGVNKHGIELLFCKRNIIIPENLLPALE